VAVGNPPQVRDGATATGHLAKTAALDAAVLAHGADALGPQPRPLPDPQAQVLAALVARRPQLGAMLTAEQHRAHQAVGALRPPVQAHIAWLEQAVVDLDRALDQTRRTSPLGRAREHLLRGVPRVGPVVSLTLLADVPEVGRLPTKRLAALVGRAPLNRDSGAWRGSRAIWGGRRHVRAALSLAALVGVRHHPAWREFYPRLLARGKPNTVALTACLQKLLGILNARLRHGTSWHPALVGRLSVAP
jgi:transposase